MIEQIKFNLKTWIGINALNRHILHWLHIHRLFVFFSFWYASDNKDVYYMIFRNMTHRNDIVNRYGNRNNNDVMVILCSPISLYCITINIVIVT